jgi:hypothetical protein
LHQLILLRRRRDGGMEEREREGLREEVGIQDRRVRD